MAQVNVTNSDARKACLLTLQMLEEVVGEAIHPGIRDTNSYGTARALLAATAQNPNIAAQTTSPFGKGRPTASSQREVVVKFWLPDCADATNPDILFDDCPDNAAAAESWGENSVRVDDYVSDQFSISAGLYDDLCEDLRLELPLKLLASARKMMKSFNDKVATWLFAQAGNYFAVDGATPVASLTSPTTVKPFDGQTPIRIQPMGWFPVLDQYEMFGVGEQKPWLIGGNSKLRAYEYGKQFVDGNVDGLDANRGQNIMPWIDRQFDVIGDAGAVAGTNRLISFLPNGVQIAEWFMFDNPLKATSSIGNTYAPAQVDPSVVRMKMDIGTAYFGVPFVVDAEISYSTCKTKVDYRFRKDFTPWRIPDEAFQTACDQAHNYILLWDMDCADLVCADISVESPDVV